MLTREQLLGSLREMSKNLIAFNFSVKPGQKKEGIGADLQGNIILRVNAPAKEGKANERIIEVLSKLCKCPKSDIYIARGESSRFKEVRIKNRSLNEIVDTLLSNLG